MSSVKLNNSRLAKHMQGVRFRPLGEVSNNNTTLKLVAGFALMYAGLGFPGGKEFIMSAKDILKFQKKQSAEYLAIGAGGALILSSVS